LPIAADAWPPEGGWQVIPSGRRRPGRSRRPAHDWTPDRLAGRQDAPRLCQRSQPRAWERGELRGAPPLRRASAHRLCTAARVPHRHCVHEGECVPRLWCSTA